MDLELEGKIAVVTGGASGIGESVVRHLAKEGAHVAILDRDGQRGKVLADAVPATHLFELDLCDEQECGQAIQNVKDRFGKIDIVINNAGKNDAVGLDQGLAAFEQSLQRNLSHYFLIVREAAAELRQNRGAIVNVGSKVSFTGQGGTSGYAAAKGAVNGLTREWAADFASHGVRVNAVIPAEVWTPMYENWLNGQPDGLAERARIENRIPLENRFTTAAEIAKAVVFLASSAASHITGQILSVDGGYVHLDRRLSGEA